MSSSVNATAALYLFSRPAFLSFCYLFQTNTETMRYRSTSSNAIIQNSYSSCFRLSKISSTHLVQRILIPLCFLLPVLVLQSFHIFVFRIPGDLSLVCFFEDTRLIFKGKVGFRMAKNFLASPS